MGHVTSCGTLMRRLLGIALIVSISTTFIEPNAVLAATRSVAPGGTDNNNCISSPCRTIGYAIGQATSGDTLTVAAGTYTEHDITISKNLTITGAGAATTILDAAQAGRGITIASVAVTISGLTIKNGSAPLQNGGGILNTGQLILNNDVVQNNTVKELFNLATFQEANGFGGGIYSAANSILTLVGTTVSGNQAGDGTDGGSGGGIYNKGTLTIQSGSAITGNTATCLTFRSGCHDGGVDGGIGDGGGIFNVGNTATVSVSNSAISGNTAGNRGGAVAGGTAVNQGGTITLDHATMASNHAGGCAVDLEAPLTMTNSAITGTMGTLDGSGHVIGGCALQAFGNYTIAISDSTISGNGGQTAPSIIYFSSVIVTIARTTIADNVNTQIDGNGGIEIELGAITITDSKILHNSGYTGGLVIQDNADATVTNTTIANNSSSAAGGFAYAGGILAYGHSLALTNSTVSGNSAAQCTQGADCAAAGGIGTPGDVAITNSTISGNTGGGLASSAHSQFPSTLTNVTVAANDVGITASSSDTAHPAFLVRNSLLANTGANCTGPISSGGYNLTSDATCGFTLPGTDLIGVNPKIGPLANNGGPTQTHALTPGSPAIDVIPAANGCRFGITTDQRGTARPFGNGCDIGAFELKFDVLPGTIPTGPTLPDHPAPAPPSHVPGQVIPGAAPAPLPRPRT